jgi:glutathione S-transferase
MLTVHGRANSPNVSMVMWALAELGLPSERLDVGGPFGGTDTPAFRAMNPTGLVPVLQDGDLVLFETGAILRYLANRYGRPPFWPDDPLARARIDVWAEWGKLTLFADFNGPVFRKRLFTRDQVQIDAGLAALGRDLDILEARLEGLAYLAGPDLTLADIPVGALLYRLFEAERPDRPALAAYYARLSQRPAYAGHVMIPWPARRAPKETAR